MNGILHRIECSLISLSRWLSLGNQETASGVVVAFSLHWYRSRERLQAQQNKKSWYPADLRCDGRV